MHKEIGTSCVVRCWVVAGMTNHSDLLQLPGFGSLQSTETLSFDYHKMTAVQPSDTVLPPLLALPTELKLQIFSYLDDDSQPSLMLLRRTHSTFRHIISAKDCIGLDSKIKRKRMLVAEHKYPFLFARDHSPCYGSCLDVLEGSQFDNYPYEKLQSTGLWLGVGARARPLGASRAFERKCDNCRVKESKPGNASE